MKPDKRRGRLVGPLALNRELSNYLECITILKRMIVGCICLENLPGHLHHIKNRTKGQEAVMKGAKDWSLRVRVEKP